MSIRPEVLAAAKKADPNLNIDDDSELEDELDDDLDTESDKGAQPNPPESDDNDDDLSKFPENYFGEDIRAYAQEHGVEAAEAYFKGLKDADRVASRRLQEIATMRKEAEEEARKQRVVKEDPPADEEPPTDEELLEQAGLDPSILQYPEGKAMAAMARKVYEMENQFRTSQEQQQWTQWEQNFFDRLGTLEKTEKAPLVDENGEAYSRQDLIELAAELNVYDPDALYWRIVGPVRSAARSAAKPKVAVDGQRRDIKRAISSKPRKRGGSVDDKKPKTLAEHYAAAKKQLNVTGDPFAY